MAKKTATPTTSPKVEVPKKAITPKKVAKPKAVASKAPKAATTTRKTKSVKSTASKSAISVSLDPIHQVVEPVIHHDDICLRAYFIGERRQQMGWPGDSATDWLDAISQLKAEALEKPLKKR